MPLPTTLADLIRLALRAHEADLHVSIPARVTRVDLAQGRVDVCPLIREVLETAEGPNELPAPEIANVPVVWPGAGGMRITFPIAAGDTVLLVFSDRCLDAWLAKGGEQAPGNGAALDARRHALTDAVAIPGLRSFAEAWAGASASATTIGDEGGPFQGAGLGAAIRTELDALWAAVKGHTHAVATTGTASAQSGTAAAAGATVVEAKEDVESATVRVSE